VKGHGRCSLTRRGLTVLRTDAKLTFMLLASVVETSRRMAATSKRLEKIDLLAALLRQLHADEVETVAAFLSGRTRRGRIGVGYSTMRDANASPAQQPSLEIIETDRALQAIADSKGPGSERQRGSLLNHLFARATEEEQQFLRGLIAGELRQGALQGIM